MKKILDEVVKDNKPTPDETQGRPTLPAEESEGQKQEDDSAISEPRFFRDKDIIGDPEAKPPKRPLIPVGRSTWWKGVKNGKYPPKIKLGPRTTVWLAKDIYNFIKKMSKNGK